MIEAQSKNRLAISEVLWKEVQHWYPKCIPLQKYSLIFISTCRSTSFCEHCSAETSYDRDPPSKPLSESMSRPDSFYTPSFTEEQPRQTDFLEKYMSEDAIDGEGFVPTSFSTKDTLLENSIISASTNTTSSPTALLGGFQESNQVGTVPTGSTLFQLLENNQFNSSTYYIRNIPAVQRRQMLLQNTVLTSLIRRQTPYHFIWFTHIASQKHISPNDLKSKMVVTLSCPPNGYAVGGLGY